MINPTQNHLIQQMQALESMARGQALESIPAGQAQQVENGAAETQSFASLMQQAVDQVNETQSQASSLRQAFELGENVDLAQVMIAVQKSRVSFEALTQVRNKLLSAYQDVMNMSV